MKTNEKKCKTCKATMVIKAGFRSCKFCGAVYDLIKVGDHQFRLKIKNKK